MEWKLEGGTAGPHNINIGPNYEYVSCTKQEAKENTERGPEGILPVLSTDTI